MGVYGGVYRGVWGVYRGVGGFYRSVYGEGL